MVKIKYTLHFLFSEYKAISDFDEVEIVMSQPLLVQCESALFSLGKKKKSKAFYEWQQCPASDATWSMRKEATGAAPELIATIAVVVPTIIVISSFPAVRKVWGLQTFIVSSWTNVEYAIQIFSGVQH